jgi:hypothetical protein
MAADTSATRRWVNRDAVEWVLYEADCSGAQLPVLLAVASFTDQDGRGAWPARSVLALLTRRSLSKVIRDLAVLVDQGHLLPGDWRRVAHIRSDKRPHVYDLPDKYRLWITGQRGSGLTPRKGGRGVKQAPNGVSNERGRGVKLPPKEVLKTSRTGARSGAQPTAAPHAPATPPPVCTEDSPCLRDECENLCTTETCPGCDKRLCICLMPPEARDALPPDERDGELAREQRIAREHHMCLICGNRLDSAYHRNVCKGARL